MQNLRPSAPQLADIEPYDPKYIAADVMLSANENTSNVPLEIRREIEHEVRKVQLNRYPDPLASELCSMIAEANGLDTNQIIVGNGGDELLFNLALAWGGPGRSFMNMPPSFSVYRNNAQLTNTTIVDVPRADDFSLDVDACVTRLKRGDIDFTIVTSPNNPSGNLVDAHEVSRLLEASDALVMVDEAYFEFSRNTVRPLLDTYPNLCILRTFSKAFSLAGVRLGYLLGSPEIIREFKKVRQPYSVDAVSQAIARVVYAHRFEFEKSIELILDERARVFKALNEMPGILAFPSESNYILFKLEASFDASKLWQQMLDQGVLVRDFSKAPGLENCLRVSIGNAEENDRFLTALNRALK